MAKFNISDLNVSADEYLSGMENLNYNDYTEASDSGGVDGLSMFSGALQLFRGISQYSSGIDYIKEGAEFEAGVYREAGKAAKAGADFQAKVYRQSGQIATLVANYNIALDEQATSRQEEALGRQLQEVASTNYATQGASGLSFGSKSFQAVQSDVYSTAEREIIKQRNDAIQRQKNIEFQGALTNMQYENQARAAEYSGLVAEQEAKNKAKTAIYQGEVSTYKAESAMADQIGGSISNLFGG